MDSSVKVRDFTTLADASESVVLVYFEASDGWTLDNQG
jgi:hypothetical protein